MRVVRNIAGGVDTISELFHFLWARRLWWMIPFIAVLLLTGALLIIGQVTGVAPFIYTLF